MAPPRSTCATVVQVVVDVLIFLTVQGCLAAMFLWIPPVHQGFYCDDITIRLPRRPDTVPSAYLLAATLVPAVVVVVLELFVKVVYSRIKSGRPALYARSVSKIVALYFYGLTVTMVITETMKLSVGRLRPHFMETCRPNMTLANCTESNYVSEVTCADDAHARELADSRKSFPSGHASFSMYCAIFLIIYLESRLIVPFSMFLKSMVQMALLLLGLFVAATRVSDHRHHLSDVIAGSIVGALVAVWTLFCLTRHMRCESFTERETGGDPTTAIYKEPVPCHHNPEHGRPQPEAVPLRSVKERQS